MIHVVGVGPGDTKFMTEESRLAIEDSEVVIGGARNIEILKKVIKTHEKKEVFILKSKLEDIKTIINNNLEKNIVVLASGDPLVYGISNFIKREFFDKTEIRIISGISSIQLAFSKFNLDMNDLFITSSHGRKPDFDMIFMHKKVAMVTDKKIGPKKIAEEVIKRGLNYKIYVGENLSYPNERLRMGSSEEIIEMDDFYMSVVILIKEDI